MAHWETDAVVTERPAVCGRLAVSWAADAWLHGDRAAVTGISLFEPGERALRIGWLPPRYMAHWRLAQHAADRSNLRGSGKSVKTRPPCAVVLLSQLLSALR